MRVLLFQLHGPMMSFGITGGDKDRPTRVRPTRSAVLGLVMGSMGIERSDEASQQNVSKALSVSALTYSEGRMETDFH
ncbi:MAG: CRISPR-associated protein Cas5, partial [bacterium]